MAKVIDKPKPGDAADILQEYASNFITHWMEDDGMDAKEKAEADRAHEQMDTAHDTVKAALKASRDMLAALRAINARYNVHPGHASQINAAIAAAEAAGL